jgi:uncharacterized protein (TIGR00369 family)
VSAKFRHLRECYGCGEQNTSSLGIVNAATSDGAESRVRFGREHQGAPGLVHGGLLATLLDEAMGTVPLEQAGIRLTSEMTIRYRRPTPIDTDLVCRARLGELSPRGFSVNATIAAVDANDVLLVEATAIYVLAPLP